MRRRRARLELLRAASFPAVTFLTLYLCGLAVGQARSAGIAGAPAATMLLCAACLVLVLAAVLMARLLVRVSSEKVRALIRAQGRAHRRLRRAERKLELALEAVREADVDDADAGAEPEDLRVRRARAAVIRHAESYRTWRQRYEESCEAPKLFAARHGYAWFLASMAVAIFATGTVLNLRAAGVALPGSTHQTSPMLAATLMAFLVVCLSGVVATVSSLHRGGLLGRLPWIAGAPPAYRREQTFPREVRVRSPVIVAASALFLFGTVLTYGYIVARVHRVQDGLASAGLALTFLSGLTAYRALLGASLFTAIDDRWRTSGLLQLQLRLTRLARRLARALASVLGGTCVVFGGATVTLLALATFEPWYEQLYEVALLVTILAGGLCHATTSLVETWREPNTDAIARADLMYERLSNPSIRNQYLTISLALFSVGTTCQLIGILG